MPPQTRRILVTVLSIPDSPLRMVLQKVPCAQQHTDDMIMQEMRAVEAHAQTFLADISKQFQHSVRVISNADSHYQKTSTPFNCYEYALGLVECDKYRGSKNHIRYASTHFVHWLISQGKMKPWENHAGIIVYCEESGVPKHAGKCLPDDRVVSKWSYKGPLLMHGINEVKSAYGTAASYFAQPRPDEIASFFEDYQSAVTESEAQQWLRSHI